MPWIERFSIDSKTLEYMPWIERFSIDSKTKDLPALDD